MEVDELTVNCGPGQLSRYSDSLRAGPSGDRIPGRGEIFRIRPDRSWDSLNLLYNGHEVIPGVKAAAAYDDHPTTSSTEVKERVMYTSIHTLGLHGLL